MPWRCRGVACRRPPYDVKTGVGKRRPYARQCVGTAQREIGVRLHRYVLAVAWIFVLPASTALAQATIEGRVILPKTRATPVVNQRYEIIAKGGVLSTNPPLAVVYLEGSFPKPAVPAVAQLTQKGLTFIPSILPIQIGTKVEFPNLDDTYHNIFSFSPPKRFDLGRYRSDEKPVPSQTFDVAGLVTLRCDIHEHMRALILIIDSPHFVMTDPDGNFRLTGLPPGRYTLKAWVDSRTTREHAVELSRDTALRVDFP
ncbi:MAG: carboxypeptidase regulatory-like domain-containing protein [Verrucomicrobia bacterium]|nr:carboxypeptidase regulatory-like domain-containing protein [Verrucomicrobiota bacterium]